MGMSIRKWIIKTCLWSGERPQSEVKESLDYFNLFSLFYLGCSFFKCRISHESNRLLSTWQDFFVFVQRLLKSPFVRWDFLMSPLLFLYLFAPRSCHGANWWKVILCKPRWAWSWRMWNSTLAGNCLGIARSMQWSLTQAFKAAFEAK